MRVAAAVILVSILATVAACDDDEPRYQAVAVPLDAVEPLHGAAV